jgi:hypothetical protein
VILYGPPASGKTFARKLACKEIKNTFGETLSEDEIFNSFIDTGIDEITADIIIKKNGTVNDKIIKEIDEFANVKIVSIINESRKANKFKKMVNNPPKTVQDYLLLHMYRAVHDLENSNFEKSIKDNNKILECIRTHTKKFINSDMFNIKTKF